MSLSLHSGSTLPPIERTAPPPTESASEEQYFLSAQNYNSSSNNNNNNNNKNLRKSETERYTLFKNKEMWEKVITAFKNGETVAEVGVGIKNTPFYEIQKKE